MVTNAELLVLVVGLCGFCEMLLSNYCALMFHLNFQVIIVLAFIRLLLQFTEVHTFKR